jgi:4-hydroxy-4-methyl-2-oxoglutarate aldolase
MVNPGDIIVADLDGVVVVPGEKAREVAGLAEERRAKEGRSRERLRAGEKALETYGLREKLKELGVEYID